MKSKNWKKLCFHIVFASTSTIITCTSMEIAKASKPNGKTKKEQTTLTISSLKAKRLISRLSHKYSSNLHDRKVENKKTTKQDQNIPVILNPITNTPVKKIINISKISKHFEDAIVSEAMTGATIKNKNINIKDLYKDFDNYPNIKNLTKELNSQSEKIVQTPPPPPNNNQQNPPPPPPTENIKQDPPPLESQPTDFPATSPEEVEQKLDTLEDERTKRLERLLKIIEENEKKQQQQTFNNELGTIRALQVPLETPQPPERKQPPSIEKPPVRFKPIGYLLARVGYFHTSNIFSSRKNPIDDGLIFSGLTLAAAPIKIAPRTYLNSSIDGNIIRYRKQSQFDYNQIRFNLGLYQQLTNKMYGEIGWNNQQLFYSKDNRNFNFASGDKFLNENSFRVSVGRRDSLAPKLNLDSFYEIRLSLTNPPEQRNRVINYMWLSLNYYLQQSLRVGLDYQFSLSNFLERTREDQYHRISANLKYGISDFSSVNLQSGFTLGGSTDRNIDFDGWFFSVNYSWDIGKF